MKHVVEKVIESNLIRAYAVWSLLILSVALAFWYAYLVNTAIFQAVETRQTQARIGLLSSELNNLQQEYLNLQNNVTMERALALGLTETTAIKFISRKSLGKGLSMRDEI